MPEGFLLDILLVLLAAKLAAEGAERIGIPPVVAEILAGIVIGPSVLGVVDTTEVLHVLGELGVILLLLEVGMQMDLGELGAVGRASLSVALIGVAVPFAAGAGVAALFGYDASTSVFVGAALTATSVGITARVFGDLRALATVEARTVLGAAVADDVLGLVILTVVVRVVSGDEVSPASVALVVAVAIGFLAVTTTVGTRVARPLFRRVHRGARSAGTLVAVALAFTLAFAQLASLAKLAPIVGAFVAGLCLTRSVQADRIRRDLAPVGHLFVPVFFLQIGIDTDIRQFGRPSVLGLAAALFAVAALGKMVAAVGLGRAPGNRLLVGLGMLPRGEVGLIFAGIGLREGVLGGDLYAALLLVVLGTTLVTPPLLRWRLQAVRAAGRPVAVSGPAPPGGWLRVSDGIVDLVAEPPAHQALHLALEAAGHASEARPGETLLEWFGGLAPGPLRWDKAATAQLFAVLRTGNARSWRLLEATGVLDRALPELAEVFERRQRDPFELDPMGALRWRLVDELHDVLRSDPRAREVHERLTHPDWVLLAALVADGAGDEGAVPLARQLVKRLDLGAAAEQEVALLVGETRLLVAAASRPDGLTEDAVLPLAAHLGRRERADAMYVLTVAVNGVDPWTRQRIDALHSLLGRVLDRPGPALLEQRRAAATRMAARPSVAERAGLAPPSLVLAQGPAVLVRQAELLEPLPVGDAIRVAVVSEAGGLRVEVAGRDRPGLLAAVTAALAEAGADVVDAVAGTWPDRGVVESFVVRDSHRLDARWLEAAIGRALAAPPGSPPVPDAVCTFDDEGSPWYTLCTVEAPDRPGLLHSLASACREAGADIHAARIATEGSRAVDRFDLTDRQGRKLGADAQAVLRASVASGVAPPPHRMWPHKLGIGRKHVGKSRETGLPYGLPESVPET
ncbi:MAG: hypothetical protein QOG87_3977 [Actinomycetota bacterium]|jgi:Kef-type K+ transport system membrane component KefB